MVFHVGAVVLTPLFTALFNKLFDKLLSKEVGEFLLNRVDEALLEKLKQNFLSLRAVLSDAEEKQFVDPHVREWVDLLIDAAYDADDVLDATAIEISKHAQSYNIFDQVKDIASSLNPLAERVKPKLKSINDKLEALVKQRDFLGLKEGGVKKQLPLYSPTTSLVNMKEVYGRDNDRDQIKKFLLPENVDERVLPAVVAIVGMAGVGKTTLAQYLFNNDEVKRRFPVRSWVYASGGFDVHETTKRMYLSVSKSVDSNITDMNLLQLELQAKLESQKFLLVLDDFWNENFLDWDLLKRPLESGDGSSIIIVTTRSQSVALTIRAALTHSLPLLSDDHSWKILSSHAFRSGNPDQHPSLKTTGGKIAQKCKGLPLAAKTLGSLLRHTEDSGEWDGILNNKIWELPNDKCGILPALMLSYSHLPSHLKRCFAYCSIFPKGWKIEKWRLISLWMAEGVLPRQKTKKRLEDVGAECFQELLSRSFFQSQGSFFVMHDLIHDLAQYVAGEFCSKLEDIKPSNTIVKPRHVSFTQHLFDGPERFQDLNVFRESLRTFLPFREYGLKVPRITQNFVDDLRNFTHLRVLSLSHYVIEKVPDSIEKLLHLRYLDLSYTNISQLSDSVVELYNLETLLLFNCRGLTSLPNGFSKLVNLRLLGIRGSNITEIPTELDRLKALQVFR